MNQTPTVGRIVHYCLSEHDVFHINEGRKEFGQGNPVAAGDILPFLIIKVWPGNLVNGQLYLDGNDLLWLRSVSQAEVISFQGKLDAPEGKWFWPPLV